MYQSVYNPFGAAASRLPAMGTDVKTLQGDQSWDWMPSGYVAPELTRSSGYVAPVLTRSAGQAGSSGPTYVQYALAAAVGVGAGYLAAKYVKPKRRRRK